MYQEFVKEVLEFYGIAGGAGQVSSSVAAAAVVALEMNISSAVRAIARALPRSRVQACSNLEQVAPGKRSDVPRVIALDALFQVAPGFPWDKCVVACSCRSSSAACVCVCVCNPKPCPQVLF